MSSLVSTRCLIPCRPRQRCHTSCSPGLPAPSWVSTDYCAWVLAGPAGQGGAMLEPHPATAVSFWVRSELEYRLCFQHRTLNEHKPQTLFTQKMSKTFTSSKLQKQDDIVVRLYERQLFAGGGTRIVQLALMRRHIILCDDMAMLCLCTVFLFQDIIFADHMYVLCPIMSCSVSCIAMSCVLYCHVLCRSC